MPLVRVACGAATLALVSPAAAAAAGAPLPSVPSRQPGPLGGQIDRAQRLVDTAPPASSALAAAGRFEQLAFRELELRPGLRARVLPRLAPAARRAAGAAVRAAQGLAETVEPRRHLPPWRIRRPQPAAALLRDYREAERAYGVPWQVLAAINLVETRLGRIDGVSTAGALGPMQFMPSTWRRYGRGDVHSDHDAIMAAARLLVAAGAPGNVSRALYAYNESSGYVRGVEAYAAELRADPRAFYGYHAWEVLYRTTHGTYLLPAGFPRAHAVRLATP